MSALRKALRDNKVTGKAEDEFGLWAFGEGFQTAPISRLSDKWNKIHGDELHVLDTDEVYTTVTKMIKIWREQNDRPESSR